MPDTRAYGQSDIQRYLQHKMSAQEMHDFEKALMDDPFLTDALEGFSAVNTEITERHLAEIESELRGEKAGARVVEMPPQKRAWWKVAAVVLVVATTGILTYSLLSPKRGDKRVVQQTTAAKAPEVAANTNNTEPKEKPVAKVDVLPKKVVAAPGKKRIPPAIIQEEKTPPVAATEEDVARRNAGRTAIMNKAVGTTAYMNKSSEATANAKAPLDRRAFAGAMAAKTKATNALDENEFMGRVTNEDNEPLPGASVLVPGTSISTKSDSLGHFVLTAKDSVLKIKANAEDYDSKSVTIKRGNPANIVLNKRQSLSDVVVTTLTRRMREANLKRLKAKADNGAEPADGWGKFEQYLSGQLDSLQSAEIDELLDEDVEIEFSIDAQGRATNIEVPDEEDSDIAKKLVQILEKGPTWTNDQKDKKVTLTISF